LPGLRARGVPGRIYIVCVVIGGAVTLRRQRA
jgi:hypothetical protein